MAWNVNFNVEANKLVTFDARTIREFVEWEKFWELYRKTLDFLKKNKFWTP